MELALVVAVVVAAVVFGYTNGFHDASNAVATSISTRALTPRAAILMAAGMNVLGALLGTGIAEVIGFGLLTTPSGTAGLVVVLSGAIGAIAWNLLTWWRGLPSSSSHALIAALVGAGLVSATTVSWSTVLERVALPMVAAPLAAFVLAFGGMVGVAWAFRHASPQRTLRRFRLAQTVSAAAMALGHGLQDAQRTMGVIVLALVAGGMHTGTSVPLWVTLLAALALGLGTAAGGWRIVRTLSRRVAVLDPARGFVAESVAAALLYATAYLLQAPVSSTHAVTAAIVGAGATRRRSAVRWDVVRTIGAGWVLTIPAAGAIGALVCLVLSAIV